MLSCSKKNEYKPNMGVYNLLVDGNRTYHANNFVVHSIQPSFDSRYVKNGLKGLKKEEKELLFKAVSSSDSPEKLLKVLGNAWGVSVPKAFKDEMNGRVA